MEGGEITPPASHYSISATPKSYCTFEDNNEFTPQSIAISDGNSTDWFEIQKHIALRELQQLVNRYNDCFRRLKDTVTFVNLLRQENLKLAAENLELAFQIEENEKENAAVTGLSSNIGSEDLEGKGKKKVGVGDGKELDLNSPGGSGSGSGAIRGGGGGGIPKSISIRSSGFLAVKHPPSGGPKGGGAHRLRLPASPVLHGGEKEGEVEVEVYNQGMAKTELCNKWGQTGWCPYGERCQFAHGIEELRPVIRHPRYKTQLCRMLGSGGECPYGHRCHFRHALPNPRDR